MSADAFTKEKFEAMIAMLDKDGDGTVSDQEFFAVWKDMNSGQFSGDEAALNAAAAAQWKIIDSDGDGNLTVQELATYYGFNFDMGVATAMTDEQILNVLAMQASLLAQEEDKAKKEKLQAAQAEAKTKPERDKTIKTIVMDEGKRRRSSKEIDDSASTSAHIDFLSCCKIGDLESSDPEKPTVAKFLADGKVNVRVEDEKGETPLHLLARYQTNGDPNKKASFKTTITELLKAMKKQALADGRTGVHTDINHQDKAGKTPLYLAVEHRNQEMIRHLFDKEIVPSNEQPDYLHVNSEGWTIMHAGVFADNVDVLKSVLAHITPQRQILLLNTKNNEGRVPLHLAAWKASEDMVAFLVNELRATPVVQDNAGITPGALAMKSGRKKSRDIIDGPEGPDAKPGRRVSKDGDGSAPTAAA